MSTEPNKFERPVVRAAEYRDKLSDEGHHFDATAVCQQTSLGDKVGIKNTGIRFCRLDPGVESTVIHYHLIDSEWVYILSGSCTLRLVDGSLPQLSWKPPNNFNAHPHHAGHPELDVQETQLQPGDFAGFPGGVGASKYAHSLVGGPDGVEYLCGGSRSTVDVCSFPLIGKTMCFDDESNPDGKVADLPGFVNYKPDDKYWT